MHSFAWWPTLIVLTIALFTNLRWRCIANWLVLPALLGGIAANLSLQGWRGFEISLAGVLVGGCAFAILFLAGGAGTDEIKLCAALGAWIGPAQMTMAVFTASLAGLVMFLGWVAYFGLLTSHFHVGNEPAFSGNNVAIAAPQQRGTHRAMPLGPAIALGTLLSFFAH